MCTHHNNKNSFYCNYKRYFLFLKIHIPHHSSFNNLNIFKRKHFTNTKTDLETKKELSQASIKKGRKKKKKKEISFLHAESFVCTKHFAGPIHHPLPPIRIFLPCKTITRGGRCTQIPSRLTTPCLRGDRSIKPSNY